MLNPYIGWLWVVPFPILATKLRPNFSVAEAPAFAGAARRAAACGGTREEVFSVFRQWDGMSPRGTWGRGWPGIGEFRIVGWES